MSQIHLSEKAAQVAEAATIWLQEVLAETRGPFHMALSGGSTPKRMFALWAQADLPWERLHLWWGDERCVPPDDADSNYRMTREALLEQVPLPPENLHRVRGEADPAGEAVRYGQEILAVLPQTDGQPVFDLIWLGMGEDGHTASIFPHEMELMTAPGPCAVATHPVSGQIRISLTGPVINAAQRVAFLITGAGKRPKLQEIFGQKPGYQAYPAAHIQPQNGELHWFWDVAAQP
ncbi:MAG: 6-phosphogluconolactonase [Bacteroidetes bacterium]|nr:MAG: 6-phosphogluconolactonase [Bacteroidota bacterium]